jgi:hypothetical protein
MRKLFGCVLVAGAVAITFLFASWGTAHGAAQGTSPWWAFKSLGANYPSDVGYLAWAAWLLGLGLYFIMTGDARSVVGTSRHYTGPEAPAGRVAKIHLLNGLLLVTSLFCAYIGAKAKDPGPFVPVFAAVAAAQVAMGLILLVLSLFEKPKSVPALVLGTAVYLAGSAGAVTVFLLGQPQP